VLVISGLQKQRGLETHGSLVEGMASTGPKRTRSLQVSRNGVVK